MYILIEQYVTNMFGVIVPFNSSFILFLSFFPGPFRQLYYHTAPYVFIKEYFVLLDLNHVIIIYISYHFWPCLHYTHHFHRNHFAHELSSRTSQSTKLLVDARLEQNCMNWYKHFRLIISKGHFFLFTSMQKMSKGIYIIF